MATKFTSASSSYNFNGRNCEKNHKFTWAQSYYVNPTIIPAKRINKSHNFFKFSAKYGLISTANISISGSIKAKASSSQNNRSSSWKKWLLGLLLTVILPAVVHKGGLFLSLKGKIDKAIETVEQVVEVVEEVAEEAEKIVEEVEEKLPGDSKLKETLESFDNLAKMAFIEAKKADDLVHKVKDAEEEIEVRLIKPGKGEAKT